MFASPTTPCRSLSLWSKLEPRTRSDLPGEEDDGAAVAEAMPLLTVWPGEAFVLWGEDNDTLTIHGSGGINRLSSSGVYARKTATKGSGRTRETAGHYDTSTKKILPSYSIQCCRTTRLESGEQDTYCRAHVVGLYPA